jgi:hypothetical protein
VFDHPNIIALKPHSIPQLGPPHPCRSRTRVLSYSSHGNPVFNSVLRHQYPYGVGFGLGLIGCRYYTVAPSTRLRPYILIQESLSNNSAHYYRKYPRHWNLCTPRVVASSDTLTHPLLQSRDTPAHMFDSPTTPWTV